MWKRREDEQPVTPVKEAIPVVSPVERKLEPEREATASRSGIATIGKSVLVKGQLSGSEDLYIDGEVEGMVELRDHNLTIGPNGRVNADLNAKDIVVLGRVKGNVRASDRLEIRKTGSVVGDIVTARVIIEDGAYFKGSIDIQKAGPAPKPEPRPAAVTAGAASPAGGTPAPSVSASPGTPQGPGQFSLSAEAKKI